MDRWDPASFSGRLSSKRLRAGFGVAPILYMLGLMGVGAGLLFSSYSQSIKNNVSMANSFAVKSDLDAAATTMAATSVLSSDGISLCPPQGGEATANCSAPALPVPPSTKMYNFYPTANPVLSGDVHLPSGYATATSAGSPVETGVFMPGAGVKQFDPWGHYYVVCRWESAASSSDPAFVILSAGPNGALETSCGSATASGDDQMLAMDASNAMNRSAIWQQGTLSTGSTGVYYGTVGSQLGVDQSGNLIVPGTITAGGSYSSINGGISLTNGDIVLTSGDISAVIGAFSGALSAASATITGNLSASGGAFLVGAGGDVTSTGNGSFTGSLAAGNGNVVISSSGTLTVGPGASPVMVVPAGAGSPVEINNELSLGSSTTTIGAVNIATTTPSTGVAVPLLSVGTPTGMPASPYLFYVDQAGNVAAATVTATSVSAGSVTASSVSGGAITATSITNSGTLSAGDTTLTDTTVNGNLTVSGSIIGNMNIGSGGVSFTGVMPIANGGTGANNIADALYNLGVTSNVTGIGHLNLNLLQNNYIPGAYLVSGSVTSTQLDNVLGVAPGTYNSVTVGADGRVTSGTFTATDVGSITDNVGETVTAGTTGITFTVGSTQQGIWTTVGLGIGTTIPGAPLDVDGDIRIQNAAGVASPNQLQLMNGATSQRWAFTTDGSAESGGSAGSNLVLQGYDNTGTIIASPAMSLTRTGNATFSGSVTAASFVGDGSGLTGIGTAAFTGVLGPEQGGTGTSTIFTPGSVVFAGASGVYDQNNANFFWDNTNARLGIGTTAPASSLQVANGGLFSVTGTVGSGTTLPAGLTGMGTRMFFYPRKAAFRAGHVAGTQWDDANIGDASVAFGETSTASGFASVALGYYSSATGSLSFAAGMANASGDSSTALSGGTASGMNSFAVGYSTASANYGASFGLGTVSASYADFVIGQYNVGGGTANSWVSTDPIFEIGVGTAAAYRANALTVLKNSRVGIGTASPASKLHVYGGEVQVGSSGVACTATNGGAVRYDAGVVYYCDGTSTWQSLLTAGAGIGSGIYLGTSSAANNPSREGEAGTGLYTAGAGLVDVAASGVQIAEFGSTGINIANGSLRLAGVNGLSFPADYLPNASIAIGSGALAYQTAGATEAQGNIALGYRALSSSALTTSAIQNTAIGYQTLAANTSGHGNTATGHQALNSNTTADENTAYGWRALRYTSTGIENSAFGSNALRQNTLGFQNVAVGKSSLLNNINGNGNVGVGTYSLNLNTAGNNNSAFGHKSLYNTTGSSNAAVGYQAGYDVTTGANNIFLGNFATTGVNVTTGSNNIMIGYDVRPASVTADNQLNIGNLIYATSLASGATLSTGYVGIGTPAPVSALHVATGGLFSVTGTYGSGDTLPAGLTGAGTRMFFYPRKAAFRAGYVMGTEWGDANIGTYSVALGYRSTASGAASTAMGQYSTASGNISTAMGVDATASGNASIAMGSMTTASGYSSTAMGLDATASGNTSTAMGSMTTASGDTSTAMGDGTTASGVASTAMGSITTASGAASTAMGLFTIAASYADFVIGQYNVGGGTANSWVSTDPIFEIGVGTAAAYRANALTVLKNSRVGIGTASPASKLHVYGGEVQVGSSGVACTATNGGAVRYDAGVVYYCDGTSTWQSLLTAGAGIGSGIYLGTSSAATNPSREGEAGTGLYTAGAGLVDVAASGVQIAEFGSTGINIATGSLKLAGVNGLSFPADFELNASIAIGSGALAYQTANATTTQGNIAIGYQAMSSSTLTTSAIQNTAIGYISMSRATSAYSNTAVGAGTLRWVTSGNANTAVGNGSLSNVTTGTYNTGLGYVSLQYTTGGSNTGIGSNAGRYLSSGFGNVAVGIEALRGMGVSAQGITGNYNTAIGPYSLQNLQTTSTQNTAIGYQSGNSLTVGNYNILVGANADVSSATVSNFMNIGNVIFGTGMTGTVAAPAGYVGIGTPAPVSSLHVASGGLFSVTGTFGFGDTLPAGLTGAGTRMFFYPRKAAFRAGYASGTQWNDASIGNYSVAMGANTTASGVYGFAVGGATTASGDSSTATGFGTVASGATSTAMGRETVAAAYNDFAIGRYNVGGGTSGSWVTTDPIFEIGIGADAANRANAVTVLKNGNVGIGTASPYTQLQTRGTVYINGANENIVNSISATWLPTPSDGGGLYLGFDRNNNNALIRSVRWNYAYRPIFFQASEFRWATYPGGSLAERMVLDVSGNVGIGTTTPASMLAVNGSVGFMLGGDLTTTGSQDDVVIGTTSALRYNGSATATFTGIAAGANGQVLYIHNPSSYTLTLSNQSASSAAANRIVTGTGADLSVPSNTSVSLQYDSTAALWRVTGSSNAGTSLPAGATTQVQYNNAGAFGADEYMTWDNTNKLLAVGTTAATPVAATGTVAGATVNVIPKTEAFGSLNGTSNMISGTSGTVGQMAYYSNANEISSTANLYVAAGNIGIATDAPSYTLTVNGNAWVTGGAWSGSDRRWKKDIMPLPNALDTISKLQGVSYNWRVDEFPSKRFTTDKQLGLIAQDVEKVVPEAVTTDKEGYKGIDYQKLTPILIEAVKQLKADNDNLRAEIEALKASRR